MQLILQTPHDIDAEDAAYLAMNLCRDRSDMQAEFIGRKTSTPVAVCYVGSPVAWVSSHVWKPPGSRRTLQTLEGFTLPDWRRRGIARMGATMLLAGGFLVADHEVAVFAYECVPLARSLGMTPRLWQRADAAPWQEVKV